MCPTQPSELLFLDLITVNRLPFPTVYATGIDLMNFEEIVDPMIRRVRAGKRLEALALSLAFHQVLDDMLRAQRFANDTFGTQEKIDFICDEKNDFSGRVGRRVIDRTVRPPLPG